MFEYDGFDPDLAYEALCEAKEMMMRSIKSLEDELDYLIECKEQCDSEEEDDYVDSHIQRLLMKLLPLQHMEMKRMECIVPLGNTDLF